MRNVFPRGHPSSLSGRQNDARRQWFASPLRALAWSAPFRPSDFATGDSTREHFAERAARNPESGFR